MASRGRTLVIGLDAFEPSIAATLIAEGRLPNLARLMADSARFELDQGPERYTGQAWHQFSTGLHPARSGRWSAIRFRPGTFDVEQPDTTEPPFTQGLGLRTVIFDAPHFNLARDKAARGIANWGSHDAGVPRTTRPKELWSEIRTRFGRYPAQSHIYGIVWADPERTRRMAEELVEAVELRRRIARWLLAERLPDWDLAILALSELHSVIETMWHGWDPTHPLHDVASAPAAKAALVAVYEASDRLVGDLIDGFRDATIIAFASHGMGPNHSDASAMILIAELMYRYSLGKVAFTPADAHDIEAEEWSDWINRQLAFPPPPSSPRDRLLSLFGRPPRGRVFKHPLDWMPTTRYRHAWPRMKAFAIPSYHDARIRLNVEGREARGLVRPADYARALEELATVLRQCVDLADGTPLDVEIECTRPDDPFAVSDWQADVVVRLKRNVLGLRHPDFGQVGPAPHRRTGGHTGQHGAAYVRGSGIESGDRGVFSTFDIPPTVLDLALGRAPSTALSSALKVLRLARVE